MAAKLGPTYFLTSLEVIYEVSYSSIQFSSFAKEYDWTKEYLVVHCISYKMFKRFYRFTVSFFSGVWSDAFEANGGHLLEPHLWWTGAKGVIIWVENPYRMVESFCKSIQWDIVEVQKLHRLGWIPNHMIMLWESTLPETNSMAPLKN